MWDEPSSSAATVAGNLSEAQETFIHRTLVFLEAEAHSHPGM